MMGRRFLLERLSSPLRRVSRSRHQKAVTETRPHSIITRSHSRAYLSPSIRRESYAVPSPMLAVKLKRAGQAFTSVVLLSVLQGSVALYRYRHGGKLAYPDGLTLGRENYDGDDEADGEADAISTVVGYDEHRASSASLLDSLLPYIVNDDEEAGGSSDDGGGNDEGHKRTTAKAPEHIPSLIRKLISTERRSSSSNADTDPIRVLVIGDSLAIGVGCIETFHVARDNSLALIENTRAGMDRQGPVFPQVLARTLSRYFRLPVQWRSAGVDGGDVYDIRSFCLDVVKQECSAKGVDIVVVLFGMNDLKRLLLENPIQLFFDKEKQAVGGLNQFRQGIEMLLADIRSHAPGAVVVFPEMPFQTSTFPLGLMLDCLVGLWERLKKMVVRGRSNAMYLEINSKEISHMYHSNNKSYGAPGDALMDEHGFRVMEECDDTEHDDVLLSPDGVHPNKVLYRKWAELVGRKLYVRIHRQKGLVEQGRQQLL
jgi:lysophospholipase L1-like esterase